MTYLEKIFNLKSKVAIVTGGLGMLGTEYVKTLARAGAKVAVFDLRKPKTTHQLVKLSAKLPIKFFAADISQREKVEEALSKVIVNLGEPQILVNNAAVDFPPKKESKETFENYPLEKWKKVLEVNLTGMMICCQVIGGQMVKSGGGSIINISSTYGLVSPDQRIYNNFVKPVSYSVSKSGVLNLTRYLATYWAKNKVRVNTLTPGGVKAGQDKNFIRKYSSRTPLGRMANQDEYNGAILFLASDASSYMTGSNLIIDGGWTAW